MKKLIYFTLLFSGVTFGQNSQLISTTEYNNLKLTGSLDPSIKYQFTDIENNSLIHFSDANQKSGMCDCMVPLDSNFVLAMTPNDDGYSSVIGIPFNFSFYGVNQDSLYINNNGNISFISPYSTFTSNPFPDSMYNMIAPFWGDVDTREGYDSLGMPIPGTGGSVWYKITPTALIVKWEEVGYFPNQVDKLNTFQLIITDGTDPLIPNGNNVAFCYGDMQWTTGSASGGVNGFGGTPATVGVNYGNGVDFFQVGRFDSLGTGFDGPYGANDQVDFLDDLEVYFNVALPSGGVNVPPMVIASGICDTIDVYTGDTLVKANNQFDFSVLVTTPEANQEVFATVSSLSAPTAVMFTSTTISQEAKRLDISINATGMSPGLYTLEINAIDNGMPTAASTNVTIPFRVNYDVSLGITNNTKEEFSIFPNPTKDNFKVELPKGVNSATISLANLTGEILINQTISSSEVISVSALPSGVYFVRITTKDGIASSVRLIKN